MELDLSKAFLQPATPFPFETEVTLEKQDVNGETVAFDPVRLKGTYFVVDDTVRVEGELHTVAHATCALCLGPADAEMSVAFDETFRKDANEIEDECFLYEGKSLPLDHMTLTLVMLNLPMRFICRESCAGTSEWQAWRNDVSEEGGENVYQPFAGLEDLLREKKR